MEAYKAVSSGLFNSFQGNFSFLYLTQEGNQGVLGDTEKERWSKIG